jgi:hypothetical protein
VVLVANSNFPIGRLLHNRISAKQSRLRKKILIETMQQQVMEMSNMRQELEAAVNRLSIENMELRSAAARQPLSLEI